MIYDKIGEEIISKMSKISGIKGKGIGYRTPKGKIAKLINNSTGEAEFIGITDDDGDYFYIRLTDDKVQSTLLKKQTGACAQEHNEQVPLTLVAVYKCFNPVVIERKMKASLLQSVPSINYACVSCLKISFKTSYPVMMDVFQRETGGQRSNWNSDIQLFSFDFVLSYNYDYCQLANNPKLLEACQ